MNIEEKIKELVESYLISYPNLFLINIKLSKRGSEISKIIIFLDGQEGVSIDECGEISRKLGNDLEEKNLIENAYNLEVSSPGIDEPLMIPQQYTRNIGRDIQVEDQDGKVISGRLDEVSETEISILTFDKSKNKGLKYSKNVEQVSFEIIKKTIVLVSFN